MPNQTQSFYRFSGSWRSTSLIFPGRSPRETQTGSTGILEAQSQGFRFRPQLEAPNSNKADDGHPNPCDKDSISESHMIVIGPCLGVWGNTSPLLSPTSFSHVQVFAYRAHGFQRCVLKGPRPRMIGGAVK